MQERFLARPWEAVHQEMAAEGLRYEVIETRSPRSFFPIDETQAYVLRVREQEGRCIVTIASAPRRSISAAGYEESLR